MNIITGYRGEAHITSAQDRAKNQGAFGTGSYILDVGDQLAAEVVSANEVRIRDGVLCMQGCVANIDEGAYDSCEISNGTQGMQRRDLIVARYTRDSETNIEDISLVVIEGTPASSSPSDPTYNTGDIQAGDSPVDFPLYRVNISGITITSTTKLASNVKTQAELQSDISTLNGKTTGSGTATNQYGSCAYTWAMRGNVATVCVEYTPNTNVTNSSGAFSLSTIPSPAIGVIVSDTSPDQSFSTVYGSARLATSKSCDFYGPRTSGSVYRASFTYVVA